MPPLEPFKLGHTAHLALETTQEKQALYPQLVNSYKWIDKIHEYSNNTVLLLTMNALKRSNFVNTNKRRRQVTSVHNVPPQ